MKKPQFLLLLFIILNLAVIWGNSMLDGETSAMISDRVGAFLRSILHIFDGIEASEGNHLLRKLAHFSEFLCLGVLLAWRISLRRTDFMVYAGAGALLAACADETIQIFSQGRGSSVLDVWIDFSGACLGILIVWTTVKIKRKKGDYK